MPITGPAAPRGALHGRVVNKIVLSGVNTAYHVRFFALVWSYGTIIDLICYFIRPVVMVTRPPPGAFDPTIGYPLHPTVACRGLGARAPIGIPTGFGEMGRILCDECV